MGLGCCAPGTLPWGTLAANVIGGYLTEINVTSPTGAQQLKQFGGADSAALLWDVIEAKRR